MGPLAQKLRNTKVDIAVSLLRLHTIRRAEFLKGPGQFSWLVLPIVTTL